MRFINKVLLWAYSKGKQLEQQAEYAAYNKRYQLHPTFRFNGKDIMLYGNGEISIGANTYIGAYSSIRAFDGCKVAIGTNCSISHNVRMYTQSSVADQDFSIIPILNKTGNIVIEDNVWIGANVLITSGVKIGSNAIVGANSVVVKDVEPFSIVGGVPAELIRYKQSRNVS